MDNIKEEFLELEKYKNFLEKWIRNTRENIDKIKEFKIEVQNSFFKDLNNKEIALEQLKEYLENMANIENDLSLENSKNGE